MCQVTLCISSAQHHSGHQHDSGHQINDIWCATSYCGIQVCCFTTGKRRLVLLLPWLHGCGILHGSLVHAFDGSSARHDAYDLTTNCQSFPHAPDLHHLPTCVLYVALVRLAYPLYTLMPYAAPPTHSTTSSTWRLWSAYVLSHVPTACMTQWRVQSPYCPQLLALCSIVAPHICQTPQLHLLLHQASETPTVLHLVCVLSIVIAS